MFGATPVEEVDARINELRASWPNVPVSMFSVLPVLARLKPIAQEIRDLGVGAKYKSKFSAWDSAAAALLGPVSLLFSGGGGNWAITQVDYDAAGRLLEAPAHLILPGAVADTGLRAAALQVGSVGIYMEGPSWGAMLATEGRNATAAVAQAAVEMPALVRNAAGAVIGAVVPTWVWYAAGALGVGALVVAYKLAVAAAPVVAARYLPPLQGLPARRRGRRTKGRRR